MNDPTHDRQQIDAKFEWKIAWLLSEFFNDDAPIGWSKYIPAADEAVKKAREIGR